MKNETTHKIALELKKAQRVLWNNLYPGYPFQASIIIDNENDKSILQIHRFEHHETKVARAFEILWSRLLYQVVGCHNNTKGTWLIDRKIEDKESFLSYEFDNSNLYIDSELSAKFYLAIQSALCEIHDKKLHNVVLWGCIDEECEYIDVKLFNNYEECKKYVKDYFLTYEE